MIKIVSSRNFICNVEQFARDRETIIIFSYEFVERFVLNYKRIYLFSYSKFLISKGLYLHE